MSRLWAGQDDDSVETVLHYIIISSLCPASAKQTYSLQRTEWGCEGVNASALTNGKGHDRGGPPSLVRDVNFDPPPGRRSD